MSLSWFTVIYLTICVLSLWGASAALRSKRTLILILTCVTALLGLAGSILDQIEQERRRVYMVENLLFGYQQKFHFINMSTVSGDKLPIFDKAPLVEIQSLGDRNLYLINLTKDYIVIEGGSSGADDEVRFRLNLRKSP